MSTKQPGQPLHLPEGKRYRYFPVKEGEEVTSIPSQLKRAMSIGKVTPVDIEHTAVREFVPFTNPDGSISVEVNQTFQLRTLERRYRDIIKQRRALSERIKTIERAVQIQSAPNSPVRGLTDLFGGGKTNQLEALRREHAELTKTFFEMRDRVSFEVRKRLAFQTEKPTPEQQVASETLFSLMRRADARRKFVVYEQQLFEISQLHKKELLLNELTALVIRAENMQFTTDPKRPPESIDQLLRTHLQEDFDGLVDRYLESNILEFDKENSQNATEKISSFLLEVCSTRSGDSLSQERIVLQQRQRDMQSDIETKLRDPRNSELAEYIQEREVGSLLEDYHVHGKTFIPVGEIKADMDTLRELVLAPGGKVARVLLYGPPGTGKTESLREIARENHQPCRVISIHEGSSFETLVGMHQLPLPRAETLKDAEVFWRSIENKKGDELLAHIPEGILEEFSGDTPAEKAEDFRRWYKYKFDLARSIAAIGAVAPDDKRILKARQEALAAWVDQPLSLALQEGAIIVLDEVDKAGKGLEGVYDLLTRRPGKGFRPAGRSEEFRIHPNARVVATSNWGDIQSERAGGGDIPPAVISRFPEKRKVDYLSYDTEMKLLEIMSTMPDDPHQSLLKEEEYEMAKKLLSDVFPKLRKMYLSPGDLNMVSPISVRTLENIIALVVNSATKSRSVDRNGIPTHFLEAAWKVVMAGPWRQDDMKKARLEIFKQFATSGIFGDLDTQEYPIHLIASRLTGVSVQDAAQILSVGRSTQTELPASFRFGKKLSEKPRARNKALFSELRFESSRMILAEEDKAWRKRIEEEGGDPDVQKQLGELTQTWFSLRDAESAEVKADPEELLIADTQILRSIVTGGIVEPEDMQVYVNRIRTEILPSRSWEDQKMVGLFISRLLYLHFENMSDEDAMKQEIVINLSASPSLDLLGYRLQKGFVKIIGIAGNYVGREMSGGKLQVDSVGNHFGNRMNGGELTAYRVGARAFQNMEGGEGYVLQTAEDRAGFGMKGGTLHLNKTGQRACNRAVGGTVYIRKAGNRLGENSEKDLTIFVEEMENKGSQCKAKIVVGPLPEKEVKP